METDEYPEGHPMMAQPALQQENCLGKYCKINSK
jgi:hypothetical protein